MNDFGYILTIITFFSALFGFFSAFFSSYSNRVRPFQNAVRAAHIATITISMSVILLIYQFYSNDFNNSYVSAHSNIALPAFYRISALWAGQQGSLLLWSFLLFLFSSLTIIFYYKDPNFSLIPLDLASFISGKEKTEGKNNSKEHKVFQMDPLMPNVLTVLMGIGVFFALINFYASNPFSVLSWTGADGASSPFIPKDGNGLNPLLQHPAMIFHPPTLYIGFVGFTIPFSFAIAALWTKKLGDVWIKTIRRWTVTSWLFLTIGIILGGHWAYVELGWGGYWAWDPVENASFLPWLSATAFVHSIIIQEKRGMLKVWNVSLILITFGLVIFGTFITRSGIVSSVHSFAKSNVGPLFSIFLLLIFIISIYLVVTRLKNLKSEHNLDSIISRESSFLFNNFILLAMAFSIFWGVIFPVISEWATNQKITVGPGFFNAINVPLGLFLLFLTGIGPLLAWRKTSKDSLIKNVLIPVIPMILTAAILTILKIDNFYFIITISFAVFVAVGIFMEFYRGTRAGMIAYKLSLGKAFVRLMKQKQRRYGGYIVHFGIVLIYVGFAGNAFNLEKRVDLAIGQTLQLGDFEIKTISANDGNEPNYSFLRAEFDIYKKGQYMGKLRPEKRFYFANEQPSTEVDIMYSFSKDLYLVLENIKKPKKAEALAQQGTEHDHDHGSALKEAGFIVDLHAFVKPLVSMVWLGGFVIILGIVIALLPAKRRIHKESADQDGSKGAEDLASYAAITNYQYFDLLERKESYLYNIKDLDEDWTMGKFGEEDYKRMRNEYMHSLSALMQDLDKTSTSPESGFISNKAQASKLLKQEIENYKKEYYGYKTAGDKLKNSETNVQSQNKSTAVETKIVGQTDQTSSQYCSKCGQKIEVNDNFCVKCGNKLT